MKIFWENILVPIAIKKLNIDIWFGPDFTIPKYLKIPGVVTIHDLIFKKFHDVLIHRPSRELSSRVDYSIKKAHKIIVPSRFTRDEVRREFSVENNRIHVIPEAADERFHKIEDTGIVSRVLELYGIDFPYLLFVGETSKRKNLFRLLHAFRLLKNERKLEQRKLLIVGKRTVDTGKIIKEVNSLGLSSDVAFTGYVPDEDLPFLYCGADIFVFPSLYEGFGIPPLEAMGCLTPVAASNATSIPDVVGDACILFDPLDVPDMAEKIDQVINNRINVVDLKKRAKITAEKFSWEKTARETLAVFKCLYPHKATDTES
jgi:glycosyltransferase involved in cell wall biosynthesis